jgi:translation initiation factor IF-1
MSSQDLIKLKCDIIDAFPGAKFKAKVIDNGHLINCVISGKIRKNNIAILKGDIVDVEVSPYDLSLGRIVYRY